MEFFDEDARPRFILQSKPPSQSTIPDPQTQPLHKPTLLVSLSLSSIFLALSILYFTSEPFKSLFIWFCISLLVGPFAPASLTAGDIRVGLGPPLEQPSKEIENSDDNSKRIGRKASKFTRKPDDPVSVSDSYGSVRFIAGTYQNGISVGTNGSFIELEKDKGNGVCEDADWIEGEEELLNKLMAKHPVGKPGRWEAITEGFKGRHSVESVIKRAKEMGERKVKDDDSYRKFLRDRKPMDMRVEGENEISNGASENMEVKGEGSRWSTGEDLALLNALKAFPKETPKRWEKIAAAVPGKTKMACLKRVNELKKDFRSSKAGSTEA